jgi:hypothetical protein
MRRLEFTKTVNVPAQFGVGIDTVMVKGLYGEARANKLEIVDAVLLIENTLSDIIAHYFFPDPIAKKSTFQSLMLGASWCTFSAKHRLVRQIIEETKILEDFIGLDKRKLDDLLFAAMHCRNAFTHGTFSTDGNTVWLDYYQGEPKRRELTDAYLAEVQQNIGLAISQTLQLAGLLGAKQFVGASGPTT